MTVKVLLPCCFSRPTSTSLRLWLSCRGRAPGRGPLEPPTATPQRPLPLPRSPPAPALPSVGAANPHPHQEAKGRGGGSGCPAHSYRFQGPSFLSFLLVGISQIAPQSWHCWKCLAALQTDCGSEPLGHPAEMLPGHGPLPGEAPAHPVSAEDPSLWAADRKLRDPPPPASIFLGCPRSLKGKGKEGGKGAATRREVHWA